MVVAEMKIRPHKEDCLLHDLTSEIDPITTATVDILEIDQVNNDNTYGYHLLRVYYVTQWANCLEYIIISFHSHNNLMKQVHYCTHKKPKLREVKHLFKVAQLANGRAGPETKHV